MSPTSDPASSRLVTPLTVLLVEDSELDAALVGEMLARSRGLNATVIRRDRLDQALGRLARGSVDLVLLDLSLPDSRGLETFEQVRAAAPEVPIIVLSSFQDEELAVTVVRNGGQDYLMKGHVTEAALARSIQYGLERHRMLQSLRGLSLLDELTGLYNRRGFVSLATSHLELAHRAGRRFVLLYADLDGLKQINDTWGHREGDLAIVKAADVLRNTFRTSDIVARLGGDEFVVLAVEAAGYSDELLVTRLEQHLAEFNRRSRLPYALAMSAGVSGYEFTSPLSLEEMLAEADRALYARKRARRALRSRELVGQA
ncbi:MAG TPA: diguanylate cyclase [Gemmatimonadales bacterium]|nr:diguanylate cyclase [Gemmatimonadales bacterium]